MPIRFIFVILFGFTLTSLLFAAEQKKLVDQFWSTGKHYQLTGEVALIAEDGIHDPSNITALYGLQSPVDAMKNFPRDEAGLIDWVQALRKGHIAPRSDLHGTNKDLKPLDLDIIFTDTGSMPKVRFPHKAHTEWLTCKNCHPGIFKQKKGANIIKMDDIAGKGNPEMDDILKGKYCGVCHGKVSFAPTKNCRRCHSVE